MKKIVFVIPFLSGGGAERVVSIWTGELAKQGNDVHLLVFYRVENEYMLDEKIVLHSVRKRKNEYDDLTKWEKIKALRNIFKDIKPDIVLPFISHVGILASIAKIGLKTTLIETIRNNPDTSPKRKLLRYIRNLSVFFSEKCIVQNKTQLEYFPYWIQKKMVVLSNPISNEFTTTKKVFINKKIQDIVAVGRLEKQKNYPMLINAFSCIANIHKDIQLSIYGEGSLYNELFDLISKLNLHKRVSLNGRTSDIADILQKSDLYILSSVTEGMPNALMEAMAIGLPCISTNCPTGPIDLIENGSNGILIPVGDKEALVEAMSKVITNIDGSIEMGRKARETILSRYTAKASAKELMKFIESI
jgi:glycosyltransferase involved in cell wall biosynthesis